MADQNLEWQQSPCSRCTTTACCRNMPVGKLDAETREDFLLLERLAAVPQLLLTMWDRGGLVLYFSQDCRHLDSMSGKCRIHNSPQQPMECREYLASRCWYTHSFANDANRLQIQLSPQRVSHILERSIFDNEGRVYRIPAWETLLEDFSSIPGPGWQGRERNVFAQPGDVPALENLLLIALPEKISSRHYDLIRFRLGFPGMWLLGHGQDWAYGIPVAAGEGSAALDRLFRLNGPRPALRERMLALRETGHLKAYSYGTLGDFPWRDPELPPMGLTG